MNRYRTFGAGLLLLLGGAPPASALLAWLPSVPLQYTVTLREDADSVAVAWSYGVVSVFGSAYSPVVFGRQPQTL